MSTAQSGPAKPGRVYAARLVGLPIFDPQGDQVGKVRDLVVAIRSETNQPRVLGLVAEVFGRRRIFVPMTRVTHIDSGQVYTTGLLNMRRFEQRPTETLVIGQMLDRTVTIEAGERGEGGITGTVYDVAMEQVRTRDWVLSRVAVQEPGKGLRRKSLRGRGQTHVVEWRDVVGLVGREPTQGATHLIAALNEMRAADAASVIHDLPPERRSAVVAALDDERLADVLEELPDEDQVEILEHLDIERAADVLEEMTADDAADLIADLAPETAAKLLELMEPDEAEDVRRLMSYAEETAGAMMTPEPVILGPDATIADARSRWPRWSTSAGSRSRRRRASCSGWLTSSACCASRRRPWSLPRSTSRWTRCTPRRRSTRSRRTSRRTTWWRRRSWATTATCCAR